MPRSPQRPTLTRERIETEALALIEREGLDAFSMRGLGQVLGVEAMSLYHHFPSKAHLLDALVDRVLGSVPIPPRDGDPAARLRQLVGHWRDVARRHARFYAWLSLHRWNSATGVAFLAEILACFTDAGLDRERAARGFRVLGYYVLGATLDETQGYANGPTSLQPMTQHELETRHPEVAQAGRYFTAGQFDTTFGLGLDVLLGGLGLVPRKPQAPAAAAAQGPVAR